MGGEVKGRVIFFQSFVCSSLLVFRSSSENCLFIDLNHTSKQRVHIRELTHQGWEFCLKRATNYIIKGRGAIKAYFKLCGQWGERRCDFFQSFFYCSLSVFRSSSENWLFIDLNHSSKQRVHIRELTHQGWEFCLKRATNYIIKGRGAIKAYFKLCGQWGERRCDFFQSFFYCSLSVFRSSSENWLFIDLNHSSKQRVHVRELTHQGREFCLKRATNKYQQGSGA